MKRLIILLAVLFVGAFLFLSSTYSLRENEYAVVTQFAKIVKVEDEAGLKLKIPFVQSVDRVSKATILYDMPSSDVITKDKKSMIADNYVLWHVTDPVKYFQSLNAIQPRAEERIEAASYNATKNIISSMSQDEVIEARGERLNSLLTKEANDGLEPYGIEILEVQIKALDLPEDNKQAVYTRMISERNNIAASYTAEGLAEAQKIRNETDKEVSILKSDAAKQAAILEAEGEEAYMNILQEAYNSANKSEFYEYMRGLDALKGSLTGDKTLILDKDSELAKVLFGN